MTVALASVGIAEVSFPERRSEGAKQPGTLGPRRRASSVPHAGFASRHRVIHPGCQDREATKKGLRVADSKAHQNAHEPRHGKTRAQRGAGIADAMLFASAG